MKRYECYYFPTNVRIKYNIRVAVIRIGSVKWESHPRMRKNGDGWKKGKYVACQCEKH